MESKRAVFKRRQLQVSDTIWISVQNRHSRTLLQDLLRSRMWKMHREPRVPEAEAQVGKWLDCRARITSKELAQLHSVKNGILRSACSTSPKMDADVVISAPLRIARLTNTPARSLKRMVTKVQWQNWRIHDNWVAYFRIWSRRSLHRFFGRAQTYWSQSDVFQFTKAVLRHANIRDQKPSLGVICPGDPHQRNPNAPKFEDRSQEETERQERYASEAAWIMARCILKLKEKHKTTFFSPSENWCQPAPSTIKPEEREFVVDSGASMDMISKKDLNSAEMDTLTKSCSPTIVITANGEVQTHEEATVYVKEWWKFLTMKLIEDTPAVLSLGKLCEEHGYSYEWINGQKPHLIKKVFEYSVMRKTSYQSWFLVNLQFLKLVYFNIHDSFRSGN